MLELGVPQNLTVPVRERRSLQRSGGAKPGVVEEAVCKAAFEPIQALRPGGTALHTRRKPKEPFRLL